jgi:hypothetical protein
MPATIRIKRRAAGGSAGSPSGLANAELAYNESDAGGGVLYYGFGTGGENGTATLPVAIAGPGAYLGLSNSLTQTAAGAYTFSGTVSLGSSATATTPDASANDTKVATTAFVKAQNYITGNQTVTISGDVTGSGTTAITATIADDAVTNAKLANVATGTIKGRVTAGTGDPEDLSASSVKSLLAITKSDIGDFDTGVRANRLDQMSAPTASVSMNTQRLTNVASPVDPSDCATKGYVDAARAGLDVKESVRAATTANVDLSTDLEAGDTVDGVTLAAGDRVLVKNQTTASQNGIYVVQASGAAVRAADFDSAGEVSPGAFTFVEEGNTLADTGWVLTTDGAITLGTTALTWTQFSEAGQVDAGDGLTKSGNTLNVGGTANRITVNPDSVDIASTYIGQNSITTLGTIGTGTWNANTIAVAKGGTGLTAAAKGSVLVANDVDTYTALDGGGSADGILLYTASSDTIAWATSLDGGFF